jgi:hypothetical protein
MSLKHRLHKLMGGGGEVGRAGEGGEFKLCGVHGDFWDVLYRNKSYFHCRNFTEKAEKVWQEKLVKN